MLIFDRAQAPDLRASAIPGIERVWAIAMRASSKPPCSIVPKVAPRSVWSARAVVAFFTVHLWAASVVM
jgi:hypothetical protein